MFWNQLRLEISASTADLNEVKRSRVARPLGFDSVSEPREPFRAADEDVVDDLCDGRLECLHRRLDIVERELEIGDLLRLQPAPDPPLGRDGLRAIAPASDQVEERRRELERPRRSSLREERGNESRLRLGRRLLLVLAVVARSPARGRSTTRRGRRSRARARARARAGSRSSVAGCRAPRRSSSGLARTRLRPRAPRRRSSRARVPDSTCIAEVDVKNRRGTSVRSSTNCSAGTSSARNVARRPSITTSPRTETG